MSEGITCSCGYYSERITKFCPECGAPLAANISTGGSIGAPMNVGTPMNGGAPMDVEAIYSQAIETPVEFGPDETDKAGDWKLISVISTGMAMQSNYYYKVKREGNRVWVKDCNASPMMGMQMGTGMSPMMGMQMGAGMSPMMAMQAGMMSTMMNQDAWTELSSEDAAKMLAIPFGMQKSALAVERVRQMGNQSMGQMMMSDSGRTEFRILYGDNRKDKKVIDGEMLNEFLQIIRK